MSEHENSKIQPVDFDVENSAVFSPTPAEPASSKPSMYAWLGLGLLGILALAVIFVLPTLVAEYELPLERRPEMAAPTLNTAPSAPINAVSPFDEAQKARQRKEAQDVLAELLEVQETLNSQGVESWAENAYAEAVESARLGDEAYLQQDFVGARDRYQEGLDAFGEILERAPTVLNSYLNDGEAALEVYDAVQAREKFSVALELDPSSDRAQAGLARAGTLDRVRQLLDTGSEFLENGQLESSRDSYRAALDLDPQNSEAGSNLGEVEVLLTERQFAQEMSEGYAALQANRPEDAIAAFQRAATFGVNVEQAEAAILQTRAEIARVQIETLRQQARDHEGSEQWERVISAYQEILKIDSNLVFAQQGQDYAGKRLNLDRLLEEAISDPLRLSDVEVYEQTVDIYYTGRGLENPGPRLQTQLDQLEYYLQNAQIAEDVNFVSDDNTRVTLLRVLEMGSFASQTLSLKPGRYVAIGIRDGYKDVRQEFVVGYDQTPDAVVVICEEEITPSGGR